MNNYSNFLKHFAGFFIQEKLKHLILHITNFVTSDARIVLLTLKQKDLKFEDYEKLSKKINDLFLDVGGEPFEKIFIKLLIYLKKM